MASESVLKELFQLSKFSPQFKGIADDDIWKACLSYKERSDDDIRIAMGNIKKKDQLALNEEAEKQAHLEQGKKKIVALRKQEEGDRKKDSQDAEKVLEELFNM